MAEQELSDLDYKLKRAALRADTIQKIAKEICKYTGLVVTVYFAGVHGIEPLAGLRTSADIKLHTDLFGGCPVWIWVVLGVSIAFGIGGVAFARARERLMQANNRRQGHFRELYEKELDRNRTSSNLTEAGGTREEDQ